MTGMALCQWEHGSLLAHPDNIRWGIEKLNPKDLEALCQKTVENIRHSNCSKNRERINIRVDIQVPRTPLFCSKLEVQNFWSLYSPRKKAQDKSQKELTNYLE